MSTEDKILSLEEAKKLVRFVPRLRGRERAVRRLSLLDTLDAWSHRDGKGIEIRAAARAHFSRFVIGDRVDDLIYMKRVSLRSNGGNDFSHEIWSVRALFEPQHRFFGAFASPDWLVLLNMQSRDFLDAIDERWHREIAKSDRIWQALFPGLRRWSGTRLSHYVTFNSEHADDRWKER
jgi:hypothetical protein